MSKNRLFSSAKKNILKNLDTLQLSLVSCVEEGMVDPEDVYYNELLNLIEDVRIVKSFEEIQEAVSRAKGLEADIAAWLARKGKTTVSLDWPVFG